MKLSPNAKCPCGSKLKYKKCCFIFHDGAVPDDALKLMVTRYSAYAAGDTSYIIRTTHPSNTDFKEDRKVWSKEIENFCDSTEFLGLEVLDFEEREDEAFVTFKVKTSGGLLSEKSRFLKVDGRWLYESGEFLRA
ncbi:MAG TPA: YchJ family metal-binding protein [Campylobacterales bacterium]|nr:YchJ family metal-binding protein [Campylobacterales bacterium]